MRKEVERKVGKESIKQKLVPRIILVSHSGNVECLLVSAVTDVTCNFTDQHGVCGYTFGQCWNSQNTGIDGMYHHWCFNIVLNHMTNQDNGIVEELSICPRILAGPSI